MSTRTDPHRDASLRFSDPGRDNTRPDTSPSGPHGNHMPSYGNSGSDTLGMPSPANGAPTPITSPSQSRRAAPGFQPPEQLLSQSNSNRTVEPRILAQAPAKPMTKLKLKLVPNTSQLKTSSKSPALVPTRAPESTPTAQPPLHDSQFIPSTAKPRHERNIEKVMLGNLCFETWYTSYYSKDLLGDGTGKAKTAKAAHAQTLPNISSSIDTHPRNHITKSAKGDGAKAHGRARDALPTLERLYVCPCCFKYSKELVAWWAHVRYCMAKERVPGEKIYIHPKGTSRELVPIREPPVSGKRGNQTKKTNDGERQEGTQGEYSVWEVDGEEEPLFCQNLSLFAKLFLETKSVFYDVTGFVFYLLVYTAPSYVETDIRHRIMGFFSKEKKSWDGNNLACILIFPPWQKKGFGNLLMGISYEISRREGLIGGPEKPISEMGKKAYMRYWGGEIARWLEGLELGWDAEETLIDMDEISKATCIAPEDCMSVLRNMGVVNWGMGPPKPKKSKNIEQSGDGDAFTKDPNHKDKDEEEYQDVRRVILDRSQVRKWMAQQRISPARPCDPDGFVEGYIKKSVEADDDGEDKEKHAVGEYEVKGKHSPQTSPE